MYKIIAWKMCDITSVAEQKTLAFKLQGTVCCGLIQGGSNMTRTICV